MSVHLMEQEQEGTIAVSQLRDGQIAEIIQCSTPGCMGAIIERAGNCIRQIGGGILGTCDESSPVRVCVLPNGTHLIVEENE